MKVMYNFKSLASTYHPIFQIQFYEDIDSAAIIISAF